MSQAIVTESKLTAIGDAIRQQLGTSVSYTLDEMASAIASISGGGGGGGNEDAIIEGNVSTITNNTASRIKAYLFSGISTLTEANFGNVAVISQSAFAFCYHLS